MGTPQIPVVPPEVIEEILSYADGDTLLSCLKVSDEFAAAVEYLTSNSDVWKRCCKEESIGADLVSKCYPHFQTFRHSMDWKRIFKASRILKTRPKKTTAVTTLNLCKNYSNIAKVLTHGRFIFAFAKYEKNFSIYWKVLKVDNHQLVSKTRLPSGDVHLTPLYVECEDEEYEVVKLDCDKCPLVAISVRSLASSRDNSLPRCEKVQENIYVNYSPHETLSFGFDSQSLLDKGGCNDNLYVPKHRYTTCSFECRVNAGLVVREKDRTRILNTYAHIKANVTCAKRFSELLLLGTDSGMLYVYYSKDKFSYDTIDISRYYWRFNVCQSAIKAIDIMFSEIGFGIVCCTDKDLHQIMLTEG